jgi:hypothetical protein
MLLKGARSPTSLPYRPTSDLGSVWTRRDYETAGGVKLNLCCLFPFLEDFVFAFAFWLVE